MRLVVILRITRDDGDDRLNQFSLCFDDDKRIEDFMEVYFDETGERIERLLTEYEFNEIDY